MKRILLAVLFSSIRLISVSQTLSGEWTGVNIQETYPAYQSIIKLFFQPTSDSTYKVFSYCRGQKKDGTDTIVVARMHYKKISDNMIYLEETEVLKPKDPIANCLIKMKLTIECKNDELSLVGTFSSTELHCDISGISKLKRKKN